MPAGANEGATEPCPGCNEFQGSLDRARVFAKGAAVPSGNMPSAIRLLSWNIAHGHDPARIATVLREIRPDIACLQEVDWGNRRTDGRDILEELAAACGMSGFYGIEFVELASQRRRRGWQGGGVTGNAILCRSVPRHVERIELPTCFDWEGGSDMRCLPWWNRYRVSREPRLGGRIALIAEFPVGAASLRVASVHLEDKRGGIEGRWSQFEAARRAVQRGAADATALVIAGDLNTYDSWLGRLYSGSRGEDALGMPAAVGEARWWAERLLPSTGFADPFPVTATTFRLGPFGLARLDWILARGARVRQAEIGPYAGSDHRVIWVDLTIDGTDRAGVAINP